MNNKVLTKYNKVKLLAEKGATKGERQAALEAMKRMETKHPELVQPVIRIPVGAYADTNPIIFERIPFFRESYSTSSGANVQVTFIWYNVKV